MTTNITNQQISLKDGRKLGYTEYGYSEGKPVFYFHGFPGSRLDWQFSDPDNCAARAGIRIIAVDRPGMGLSDFKQNREMLDWPDDVTELADQLDFQRFGVMGISGGGPYAAACAYKIPERLSTTLMVSSMGPFNAPHVKEGLSWTIPGKPSLGRRLLLMLFNLGLKRDPDKFVIRSKKQFPEPDRLVLDKPEMTKVYIEMLKEAFRSGIRGAYQEAKLYARPWKFRLQDISTRVYLWHGEKDENVPVSVGHFLADSIPDCQATFLENDAHISLSGNHINEILNILND